MNVLYLVGKDQIHILCKWCLIIRYSLYIYVLENLKISEKIKVKSRVIL